MPTAFSTARSVPAAAEAVNMPKGMDNPACYFSTQWATALQPALKIAFPAASR